MLFLLVSTIAQAQSVLEEITVTASKRETSLQDTSIAISAFTGERLEHSGIDSVELLAGFVPNMVVGNNNANAMVMIRGIGTLDNTIISDPSVAINIDGSYIPRAGGLNMLMYDTERVEVLRGPQGTLYGRNSTGGSVNILSTRPQGDFGAEMDFLYGDYDWTRFRGAINAPIVEDELSARVSIVREDRDGLQENTFPGGTVSNDIDALAVRGQLLWTPTDDLSVLLKADSVDYGGIGPTRERIESPPGPNGFAGTMADPAALNSVYKNDPEAHDLSSNNQVLNIDWGVSDSMELTFIASRSDLEFDIFVDGDMDDQVFMAPRFAPPPAQALNGTPEDQFVNAIVTSLSNTQELRLASTGDDQLQWMIGLYRFDEEATQEIFVNNTNPFAPILIHNTFLIESESQAIFGQASYKMSDSISLSAGVRYSEDEKKGNASNEVCLRKSPFAPPFVPNPPCMTGITAPAAEWDNVSWLVGVDWFPSDDHTVYAKVSTGFKAGGFNFDDDTPAAGVVYNPEEILAYELGWKALLLDGKMQLNSAVFYYDYSDLQLSSIQNFILFTDNAAEASVKGLEMELVYQPTDNLLIDGGFGWLDATFDEYISVDVVDVPAFGGPPPPAQSFAGNTLANAPEYSISLGIQYTFGLGENGSLTSRVQTRWQDDWFLRPYNLPADMQDSYAITDIRLTWQSMSGKWSVAGFLNNVSDEVRTTSVEIANGGFFGNSTLPKMWGVQIGYNH